MQKPHERTIRVLVADDESLISGRLVDFLKSKSFNVRYVRSGNEAMQVIQTWYPDFVLYDLMLPELNALEFLSRMSTLNLLGEGKTRAIILSGHNNPLNIRECMRLGASDYIPKPATHADVLSRIILQLQPKREVKEFSARSREDYDSAQYYMHLTDLTMREALKGAPVDECLHNLSGLIGVSLKAVRASVVKVDLESRRGFVVASNDKRNIGGLPIDLAKYPEIIYVLHNDKLLALDNLAADPTMHFVTRQTKEIAFNTMIVAPIRLQGSIWGVLSIRLPESKKSLSEFEIRYAQLVAHVIGLVVRTDPEFGQDSGNSGNSVPQAS